MNEKLFLAEGGNVMIGGHVTSLTVVATGNVNIVLSSATSIDVISGKKANVEVHGNVTSVKKTAYRNIKKEILSSIMEGVYGW